MRFVTAARANRDSHVPRDSDIWIWGYESTHNSARVRQAPHTPTPGGSPRPTSLVHLLGQRRELGILRGQCPPSQPLPGALHGAWASTPSRGPGTRRRVSPICSALSTYYAQCPLENWGCRTGGICPQGKEETLCLGTTVWGAQAGRARAQAAGSSLSARRALTRDGPRGDSDRRGAILPRGHPRCRSDSCEL